MTGLKTKIGTVLRNPKMLAELTGQPFDKPAAIAMNAAGLLAASEMVGIFALFQGDSSDKGYEDALRFFATTEKVSNDPNHVMMWETAERVAHATWATCQIYRGILESPETPYQRLERVRDTDGKPVLDVYDNLPAPETAKDWEQIKKYAVRLQGLIQKLS